MRPIRHALNVAVFYRVPVNIVHVRGEIRLVANQVFPKPLLPKRALPFLGSTTRQQGFIVQAFAALLSDDGFNDAPAGGKIGIALGQGPDAMQVIR